MKRTLLSSAFLAGSLIGALPARASTVYTDGVSSLTGGLFFPATNTIVASVNPGGGGDLGELSVSIDSTSLVMSSVTGTLGIGHDWYVVTDGTIVGPDLVNAHQVFGGTIEGIDFGHSLQLVSGQPFMLGIWLDSGGSTVHPGPAGDHLPGIDDRFGWVKLSYTSAGGLVMLSNAMSVSDPIIAGTTTTIPESSSMAFVGLAGLAFLRRRR